MRQPGPAACARIPAPTLLAAGDGFAAASSSSSSQQPFEPEHLRTCDSFYENAQLLRDTFDQRFAEPRQAHADRFVWDYWYVPDQYTLHRTQAATYFDADDFDALADALTTFGQKELGCRSISPPWLSFYVDGSEQALHADVPQGPFAYVLSLTDWEGRAFTGGETTIMQPHVLDFWRGFDSSQGLEFEDLFNTVEPRFNRLTCFDARLPHGVRRVEGERDPRGARLVIHGWFTEPEPFFEGGLDGEAVRPVACLDDARPLIRNARMPTACTRPHTRSRTHTRRASPSK